MRTVIGYLVAWPSSHAMLSSSPSAPGTIEMALGRMVGLMSVMLTVRSFVLGCKQPYGTGIKHPEERQTA